MSEQYLLAIDGGTGGCRAVLFEPSGKQVAVGQREWSHLSQPAYPGSQVFDTRTNWELICSCIQQVLATPGVTPDSILAVSSASMREGMVLYDKEGRGIWAAPTGDSRAGAEAA